MEISIIDNDKENHEDDIGRMIKDSKKITIAVAFLKSSGLDLIWDSLKAKNSKIESLLFIIGLDFYQTEPKALWRLFELREKSSSVRIKICQKRNQIFHPKLYLSELSNSFAAVIGSANMTSGGLNKNFELSCIVKGLKSDPFYSELKAYVDSLETISEELTIFLLSQYQRKFDIHKNNVKVAEKKTKEEISGINEVTSDNLSDYLEGYLADSKEQNNWKRRIKDYKNAKKILDQLADDDIQTKAEFMALYNNLVGGRGYDHLWHSGSIHRSKNKVSKKYKSFCKIVKKIREELSKNVKPEVVFEESMDLAHKIDGCGANIITEIMNTYSPKRCAVLNKNPLTSLVELGFQKFKSPQLFKASDYKTFTEIMLDISNQCGFSDLSQADHLCNYIYWQIKE
jgi:HKD family nuclease